jgi:hypothetical protein
MSITLTIERDAHRRPSRLAAVVRSGARAVSQAAVRAVKPNRKAIENLRSMPLFLAGGGCVDFAAFHVNHGFGWLVMGISLIVAELAVADE